MNLQKKEVKIMSEENNIEQTQIEQTPEEETICRKKKKAEKKPTKTGDPVIDSFIDSPKENQILTSGLLDKPKRQTGPLAYNSTAQYFMKAKFSSIAASLICCLAGVILGTLVMLILNPTKFVYGYGIFWSTGFEDLVQVLYNMAPLVFCGLSVALCYKCGMFNIGASAQYALGGFSATLVSFLLKNNVHWSLLLIIATFVGLLVGALPGILKAYFRVNEVISAIMINWIALYFVRMMVKTVPGFFDQIASGTVKIPADSISMLPYKYIDASSYPLNIAVIIAIVVAIVVSVVLSKTTFGYKLKATGFNRNAAEYAGINSKLNIVLAFALSGAIAGLGGACAYLLPGKIFKGDITTVWQEGFDGISVSFLANGSPIGIIFSGLFISLLKVCGKGLTVDTGFDSSAADITISIILYLSAFSLLIYNVFMKDKKKKEYKLDTQTLIDNRGDPVPVVQAKDEVKEEL